MWSHIEERYKTIESSSNLRFLEDEEMSDSVRDRVVFMFDRSSFKVSESNPGFEQAIIDAANEKLVKDGCDPSEYRLGDIGVDGDKFVALMIRKDQGADEVEFALGEEVPVEESPRADAEQEPDQARPSAAYEGPWADRKFEIDVVQMCAILDLVNYAMMISRPTDQGGMGAITETLPRSLGVVNNLCIRNTCVIDQDEIREAVESGRRVEIGLDDDFKQHFDSWMTESLALFEKQFGSARKKVVQAKMMPGPGFDPRGGSGKGGLVIP